MEVFNFVVGTAAAVIVVALAALAVGAVIMVWREILDDWRQQ